jgi:hypothetical protein
MEELQDECGIYDNRDWMEFFSIGFEALEIEKLKNLLPLSNASACNFDSFQYCWHNYTNL